MKKVTASIKQLAVLLGFCSLLFSSCSTDFDPNAEYKETMVIYALLDPTETTHYVKVNKAFLNNRTSAVTIAANNPDSITYQNEIIVELQKLRPDSSVIQSDTLTRTVVNTKEAGTFFSPQQTLYKAENVTLDPNFIYRVKATNPQTGKVAYGSTEIVKPVCVSFFSSNTSSCLDTTTVREFKANNLLIYTLSQNATIYKVVVEFNYTETVNGVTVPKTISYDHRGTYTQSYQIDTEKSTVRSNDLISQIDLQIDNEGDPNNITRKAGLVKVKVIAGSEALGTYFRVNNSYSAITQSVPEYSNVRGGIGLVASRYTNTVKAFITKPVMDSLRILHPELKFE